MFVRPSVCLNLEYREPRPVVVVPLFHGHRPIGLANLKNWSSNFMDSHFLFKVCSGSRPPILSPLLRAVAATLHHLLLRTVGRSGMTEMMKTQN